MQPADHDMAIISTELSSIGLIIVTKPCIVPMILYIAHSACRCMLFSSDCFSGEYSYNLLQTFRV